MMILYQFMNCQKLGQTVLVFALSFWKIIIICKLKRDCTNFVCVSILINQCILIKCICILCTVVVNKHTLIAVHCVVLWIDFEPAELQ